VTPAWRRGAAFALWAIGIAAAAGTGAMLARTPKPVTHTVTIDGTSYKPARLVVHVGDTVVWQNKDIIPHTATAKAGAFDSKMLATDATFRFTVTAKGGIDYACLYHPTMTGRIEAQ
jgi:plastocyanin